MRESWDEERDPLAALQRGESGPFEAFVVAETATFLAFFLHLGASRAEADDLVQDLFVKLFQHAPRYRSEERFGAFAFRVAHNAWIDRTRRVRAQPAREPGASELERVGELPAREPEPFQALAGREDAHRVAAALGELPETHRSVFELGVVQELSYAEIGALLSIPVGTVKSRMFHAIRKLRERLAPARAAAAAVPPPASSPALAVGALRAVGLGAASVRGRLEP